MADDALVPCIECGEQASIIAVTIEGQQCLQGVCLDCGAIAPESTNRQRAIDFWNAWNMPDLDEDDEDDEDDMESAV